MRSRPFAEADFAAVAALLADDERAHGRPGEIGVEELHDWTGPVDLEHDTWLYEDDDGPVAAGWVFVRGDLGTAVGVVHPRAKGRGLGSELVERGESALRGRTRRVHQFALGNDAPAAELLTSRGYRDVRRFYDMAIELDDAPAPPDVPVDICPEEEARAFHAALEEAFADHWEHHPRPFEDWWQRHSTNPGYDPSLWFVVRDGGEIAAVARNEERDSGGYVGHLGVRRAWRGRGYAKALLLHTFREFHARGIRRVTLGVDAENPTGATHLYERVGMHVEYENVVYEKVLA